MSQIGHSAASISFYSSSGAFGCAKMSRYGGSNVVDSLVTGSRVAASILAH
jgi:hypothetical protein